MPASNVNSNRSPSLLIMVAAPLAAVLGLYNGFYHFPQHQQKQRAIESLKQAEAKRVTDLELAGVAARERQIRTEIAELEGQIAEVRERWRFEVESRLRSVDSTRGIEALGDLCRRHGLLVEEHEAEGNSEPMPTALRELFASLDSGPSSGARGGDALTSSTDLATVSTARRTVHRLGLVGRFEAMRGLLQSLATDPQLLPIGVTLEPLDTDLPTDLRRWTLQVLL